MKLSLKCKARKRSRLGWSKEGTTRREDRAASKGGMREKLPPRDFHTFSGRLAEGARSASPLCPSPIFSALDFGVRGARSSSQMRFSPISRVLGLAHAELASKVTFIHLGGVRLRSGAAQPQCDIHAFCWLEA